MKPRRCGEILAASLLAVLAGLAADPVDNALLFSGEDRVTQDQIVRGELTRDEIRLAGRRMFTTPFTREEGYGDGGDAAADPAVPRNVEGNRTTLQDNGTFLRVNGLDAQTCLECHSIVSRATVPMRFGVGGAGGVNNTVLGAGGGTYVDAVNDPAGPSGGDGKINIDARVINPPFVFGSGGVELLAKEMTRDLQALKSEALARPGTVVSLTTKGIDFGTLVADAGGNLDTSGVVGVEADPESESFLAVAPFGRKGDNASTRAFDRAALQFHLGMQVDEGDPDGDGVSNEVTVGELSALSIFVATLQTPFQTKMKGAAKKGERLFREIGCAGCHVPSLRAEATALTFSNPEIPHDPDANVFYSIDLREEPMSFAEHPEGGLEIPLHADLRLHHMGPSLAEAGGDDRFTTMRLWGVADTAPYLHDGRALTLREAILLHGAEGSEAAPAVASFRALGGHEQDAVLAYLGTLRSPDGTNPDLDELAEELAGRQD